MYIQLVYSASYAKGRVAHLIRIHANRRQLYRRWCVQYLLVIVIFNFRNIYYDFCNIELNDAK
jgi:hypothetical protein